MPPLRHAQVATSRVIGLSQQVIRLALEAEHMYHLRAAVHGSGRSFSYGNDCTMWIEDALTGTKAGHSVRWLNRTGPFGPPPAATGKTTEHVH